MSTRRKWFPLISVGLAYVGLVAAFVIGTLFSTPEYEHATYLHIGLIALGWSLFALVAVAVSSTSLLLVFGHLRQWLRWMTLALNVPVVVGLAAGFQISISSLQDYEAGFAAYDTAVHVCGHPPVLASAGWGGDVLIPSDSEYERLKYSTQDHLLLGVPRYYCTVADAEGHGYQRAPWHSPPP